MRENYKTRFWGAIFWPVAKIIPRTAVSERNVNADNRRRTGYKKEKNYENYDATNERNKWLTNNENNNKILK